MHFKNNFKVHKYKIVLAQTLGSKGVKSLGKQPSSTFHTSPKGMCIVKVTFWISSSASHLHLPGDPLTWDTSTLHPRGTASNNLTAGNRQFFSPTPLFVNFP